MAKKKTATELERELAVARSSLEAMTERCDSWRTTMVDLVNNLLGYEQFSNSGVVVAPGDIRATLRTLFGEQEKQLATRENALQQRIASAEAQTDLLRGIVLEAMGAE